MYVSGHGFGHSVRCAEVAAALLRHGARVIVRTDAPPWLFPAAIDYVVRGQVDVGVAQHDGLQIHIDRTRENWRSFAATFEERAWREAEVLQQHDVDFVLGDIPPLAFAAARMAGIPSAALGNFGWDWIYGAWPDFGPVIECVQHGYSQADLLLRLPLHSTAPEAFPSFETIEDVPLIARRAKRSRNEMRAQLGVHERARVVLLSFGAFTADGLDLAALVSLTDYRVVLTPPLSASADALPQNVLCLREQPSDYVSLLAACDVVITKPGYGIVADCLANRIAVLFTSRGPFREYDVLAEALTTLGRARYVPRDDLLAGHIAYHLAALEAQPDTWADIPLNGAEVVANRVLQLRHGTLVTRPSKTPHIG
jgi:hypothetical protein